MLNATFEPLCVVSDRRAVVLVLGEVAEMLHASEAVMHSAHLAVAVPSVVRLHRYARVPYRWRTPLNRRSVFARDGHRCQYCGGRRREHRPRGAPQPRRRPHVGQRGRGLPPVQRPQARPLPARDVDAPAAPAGPPAGVSRLTLGLGRRARGVGAATCCRRRDAGPPPAPAVRSAPVGVAEGWAVRHLRGEAGELHLRPLPAAPEREVWVLGARAAGPGAGLDPGRGARRPRRGGPAGGRRGAPPVGRGRGDGRPDDPLWVDVVLPAGDPLWHDDVGRAAVVAGRRLGRGAGGGGRGGRRGPPGRPGVRARWGGWCASPRSGPAR